MVTNFDLRGVPTAVVAIRTGSAPTNRRSRVTDDAVSERRLGGSYWTNSPTFPASAAESGHPKAGGPSTITGVSPA
jgi:hypothetical protein